MKNIFINPDLQYLRAGWRLGIFIVILSACTAGLGIPIGLLLKQIPAINVLVIKTFIIYLQLTLATWIMLRYIDKRPFQSVGLTFKARWGKELLQGCGLGAGMISVVFVVEYTAGMVHIEFYDLTLQQMLPVFFNSLFLYVVVGYGEELLFRGYILQVAAEGMNRAMAAILFAVFFASAHFNNPNVSLFGLMNVGLAGIWLALAYYKTNALWLPIGLHFSWNFFQGFVYSFPVSGTTSVKEQIGKAIVSGPEWITGGAFGPEGGALTTVLLIGASVLIYKSSWFKSAEGVWRYERWMEERKQQLALQPSEQRQP